MPDHIGYHRRSQPDKDRRIDMISTPGNGQEKGENTPVIHPCPFWKTPFTYII
jgi:hypothetical protein